MATRARRELSNHSEAKPTHAARGLRPSATRSPQPMHGVLFAIVWRDAPWPHRSQNGSWGMLKAVRLRRISCEMLMLGMPHELCPATPDAHRTFGADGTRAVREALARVPN